MNVLLNTAAQLASNPIVSAISRIYGVVTDVNDFLDKHIGSLKANASATVRATGNVLEGAKFGFGLGYITPIAIIAIGQIILGNPLTAVAVVAKGVAMANPVAMTCGAIGAVYYGWSALTDEERNAIIARIAEAFSIGAELVKSFVAFLLNNLGDLLSSESLAEYKRMITAAASGFGRSLGDVTGSVTDRLSEAGSAVSLALGRSADVALVGMNAAADVAAKGGTHAVSSIQEGARMAWRYFGKKSD